MFSSTQTLPPRTKRWAEAKVLADCVAVRVSVVEGGAEARYAGYYCMKARGQRCWDLSTSI